MCRSSNKILSKKGELYEDYKHNLRPFDLIFFKGDAIFSAVISALERHGNKMSNSGEFSHVAMIVNSDVLIYEGVLPGKLYVLESIVGGTFAHNVKDIKGKVKYGVQIRDLDEIIPAFDKSNKTTIAWGKIKNNPLDTTPINEIKLRLTEFCTKYVGKSYEFNPYNLLSSVFPSMRKYRSIVEKLCHNKNCYFCSEIVALAFKEFGIYPGSVNEKDVLPRDIIYPEADTDKMPKIVETMTYITTPIHYNIKNRCITKSK